ncbi:MAG: DUF302 domain-containing protein [Hyphomicrobiaceae bacterium]|nr:MAG: DUF302 domain-containing protein [Hyphomicrobiaceae bacterium]
MSAMRLILTAMLALFFATGAQADAEFGYRTYAKTGTFEDVRDDLKDAIINRGFVIDYVGHFNAMLERTAEAAQSVTKEGVKSPYRNAQFVQFCPAKLVHESVSASPVGIANCPIAVFVYELRIEPGKIHIGYRLPVASQSQQVKKVNDKLAALLHEIALEATK